MSSTCPNWVRATPTSFRAASSSEWRWRARLPFIRRCSCSTSRSRPWMPRSVWSCVPRSAASSSELGITTVYVTHDQEEALSLSDRIVVMNAGRVEQIGKPFDIYNYPTTGFVAAFIGQLNLLPVVVQDSAAGTVALGSHIIRTGQTIHAANGADARLAIRPEELRIQPLEAAAGADAGEDNHLQALVESVTFLGAIVRVKVSLDGAADPERVTKLSVDLFNERQLILPQVGQRVDLSFPQYACWLSA